MKIAIHHRPGSFSDRWIAYCKEKEIPFKIVDAYRNDIIQQVEECQAFMWHHTHGKYKDVLSAKNILFALEHAGMIVYPDFRSNWHFDDKVAQLYLLESIDAPLVPSYIFYNKKDALEWAENTSFPKVFKLKGGSGSRNVILVEDLRACRKIINIAFGRGFSYFNPRNAIKDDLARFRENKNYIDLVKACSRYIYTPKYLRRPGRERGYVYFQDFIPDNKFDTRIVVIGEKAIGERRFVRKNDFRASGSGKFAYDNIDLRTVDIAFKIKKLLNLQSVAFDFVHHNSTPLIVEVSYGFGTKGIMGAPGYWDSTLNWHSHKICPEEWILEEILAEIRY